MCIFAAPAVAAGTSAGAGAGAAAFGATALPAAAFTAPAAVSFGTAAGLGSTLGLGATTAATTAATGAGLFGLGTKVSNLFLTSLGLTAGTGLMQKAAAEKTASQIYQSSLIAKEAIPFKAS